MKASCQLAELQLKLLTEHGESPFNSDNEPLTEEFLNKTIEELTRATKLGARQIRGSKLGIISIISKIILECSKAMGPTPKVDKELHTFQMLIALPMLFTVLSEKPEMPQQIDKILELIYELKDEHMSNGTDLDDLL